MNVNAFVRLPTRYINLSQIRSITFDTEAEITASIDWAGSAQSFNEHLTQVDAEPLLAVVEQMLSIDASSYWEDKEATEAEIENESASVAEIREETPEPLLWLPG